MENKRITYLLPIALGLSLAIGLFFGRQMASGSNTGLELGTSGDSRYQKMQDIINIINNYYVDSVNGDELFETTIRDMLHKLDPHSSYIPAEELKLANEQIQGEFAGVGVRFFVIRDTICVTHVIPGSPSEAGGVLAGDKILKVDGKNLSKKGVSSDDVMSALKGPRGTAVQVTLLREGKKLNKRIVRGSIPINSISAAFMLNERTGFIKIDQFSLSTDSEFNDAADQLIKAGMKQLILDLRNNPGGVLSAATRIADEFLPSGKVIVSTKGEHSREQEYISTSTGKLERMQVVILVNENSASASEILAGALQDHDRATIVGRRSFGKGLVQEDMVLRDGSSLRLTIARYYTPTGRSIQKPYNGNIEDYYHDQMDRYDNGELYAPDSSIFVDSLKYITPGGKVVYGGGGIMPDVFVPLDTLGSSWYLSQLRYTLTFQSFAFEYVDGKRSKWKTPQQFASGFTVSDDLLRQFTAYSEKYYDIAFNARDFATSKSLMKELLKAEIARQLWTETGYFMIISRNDKEVLKALKEF